MSDQTASVTFNAEQITEQISGFFSVEACYFSAPRPERKFIVQTATIAIDQMDWIVAPYGGIELELAEEFDAWEAASDDDLARFEAALE